MFYIDPIYDLTVTGVADPSVPNYERIIIRPTQEVNLAQFGIFIGIRQQNGTVTPLRDLFYWFGDKVIAPPSWIVLYTGSGKYSEFTTPETNEKVYSFHWGRKYTLFNHDNIVPVLFKMDRILIGSQIKKNKELSS